MNIRDVLRPTHSERSSITFPWSWYGPVAYDSQVRYIYEDVSKLTKDAGYPVYNYYYLPSHSIDFGGNQSRWLVLFLLEHSQEKGAKILRFALWKTKIQSGLSRGTVLNVVSHTWLILLLTPVALTHLHAHIATFETHTFLYFAFVFLFLLSYIFLSARFINLKTAGPSGRAV